MTILNLEIVNQEDKLKANMVEPPFAIYLCDQHGLAETEVWARCRLVRVPTQILFSNSLCFPCPTENYLAQTSMI